MNILLINGSPKGEKSNTLKLSKAFVSGISQSIQAVCDKITVKDMDIRPCRGCFACWSKTQGKCVIDDEMKQVLEKILNADLVIWSFGLYYFNVPSVLKTLIDRQLPLALPFMDKSSSSGSHPARYDMSGKRHVVISTCGFYTAKGNYDSVNSMFDHFLGKDSYERIYCGQGELFRVPELHGRTDEYLGFARKAGEEFAAGGIKPETRANLNTLLFEREVFEKMADASWGVEKESGEKIDDSLSFTRQMAALYNKNSYNGDKVLEMEYTDIGTRYQILMKRDGSEVISENFKPYTTKIETPLTVWKDIASGKISGTQAMAQKLYRVEGDFEMMINWDNYFGSRTKVSAQSGERAEKKKSTSLLVLLVPWITFWIAASIDMYAGAFIAIGVCALTGLVFFHFRKTIYDVITTAAVTGFSVLLLLTNNPQIVLPISYLAFGAMWCVSCLFKIPLTAWYSMNSYNGETALENPLFIRTNRILTLVWGVLYLLTGMWTFLLTGTPAAPYLVFINNAMPILMGIFTNRFQKWYPAHFAAK